MNKRIYNHQGEKEHRRGYIVILIEQLNKLHGGYKQLKNGKRTPRGNH